MAIPEPTADLDARFSSPGATPTSWAAAREALGVAEIFWVTTVRPDERPHVTPLIAVWLDGALFFCTGATERKALNLAQNAHCVLTTGCNTYGAGLDLVIEGDAVQVRDETTLQRVADAYEAKYGSDWHFDVRDGAFVGGEGNVARVYAVAPATAFGFSKGEPFGQTRWKF
ncbi:MAG TPA: pyridoxamine 5'-phosphate oxidase family protein [Thermomicrobiales bacterium]|jgi:predicted small secreted protein